MGLFKTSYNFHSIAQVAFHLIQNKMQSSLSHLPNFAFLQICQTHPYQIFTLVVPPPGMLFPQIFTQLPPSTFFTSLFKCYQKSLPCLLRIKPLSLFTPSPCPLFLHHTDHQLTYIHLIFICKQRH